MNKMHLLFWFLFYYDAKDIIMYFFELHSIIM